MISQFSPEQSEVSRAFRRTGTVGRVSWPVRKCIYAVAKSGRAWRPVLHGLLQVHRCLSSGGFTRIVSRCACGDFFVRNAIALQQAEHDRAHLEGAADAIALQGGGKR